MRLMVYMSVWALYGEANVLYRKSFKRQNSTNLTLLKYQNTKTALYELHKNHWVFALFEIFGPVRKRLQSTVFNDHPVASLDFKLSVSESFTFFTASASTGLSELFLSACCDSILMPPTFPMASLNSYTPKFSGDTQKLTWCQQFGLQIFPKLGDAHICPQKNAVLGVFSTK